ncbi:MAG: CocE/NonD family hydrolase, partial [Nitrososphaerales archaeon]
MVNPERLIDVRSDLSQVLKRSVVLTPARYAVADISCKTVMVEMRDGIKLATDLYLPPILPVPAIAMRTPYDRASDGNVGAFLYFARRGYAVVSQDCRGTGGSEPDFWNYYLNEPEDGYDLVEWIGRQEWFKGFLGSCGGSYVGQTQWQMAMHPRMSTIVPDVSGLGIAINTAHLHMFANAYARSMGKGEGKIDVPYFELEARILDETLASGYFNDPLHKPFSQALLERFPNLRTLSPSEAKKWLWQYYCSLSCAERVEFVKQAMGVK